MSTKPIDMKKIYTFTFLIITAIQSNAQIVHTDIPDVTLTPTGTATYNLDFDGATTDFVFEAYGTTTAGYTNIQDQPTAGTNPLNGILDVPNGDVQNLSMGTSINATTPTWNLIAGDIPFIVWLQQVIYGIEYIAPNQMGYVGCKFIIGTAMHYGWVRVTADNNQIALIIHEYAYEATAGVPILAGDNGLTTSINSANNTDINILHANRQVIIDNPSNANLDVRIATLSGQVVKSEKVITQKTTLDTHQLSSGIYIVSVYNNSNGSMIHRKIMAK